MSDRVGNAIVDDQTRRARLAEDDSNALNDRLARDGRGVEPVLQALETFSVALPSWGVGTGGTRFARFPARGEPSNIWQKLEDCSIVQRLTRMTSTVSVHLPWDEVEDTTALRHHGEALGLGFDAVNSNSFQDQPGQALSYKFGSLSHTDAAVRAQAVEHNRRCIEAGKTLGSRALTLWVGDGANFPGQQDMTAAFEHYLDSARAIYAELPDDWTLLIEHKLYEPAFYATVIADWGTSLLAAQTLGERARCLVDLGHHAPTTNVEQIVARLAWAGKLGGFHFNDSKYGDDDLDSGSIDPFALFLVFHELTALETLPSLMIDQSHNVTDPIESLVASADAIACAYARALLVDRARLAEAQAGNDALAARLLLQDAFQTDVRPLAALARARSGGAVDPIAAYRSSGYRDAVSADRPVLTSSSSGIV